MDTSLLIPPTLLHTILHFSHIRDSLLINKKSLPLLVFSWLAVHSKVNCKASSSCFIIRGLINYVSIALLLPAIPWTHKMLLHCMHALLISTIKSLWSDVCCRLIGKGIYRPLCLQVSKGYISGSTQPGSLFKFFLNLFIFSLFICLVFPYTHTLLPCSCWMELKMCLF